MSIHVGTLGYANTLERAGIARAHAQAVERRFAIAAVVAMTRLIR